MKNIIIYAVVFISTFIGITYAIYTYNNEYANIFEFDFRDQAAAALADSIAAIETDSLVVTDSLSIIQEYEETANEYMQNYDQAKAELDKSNLELEKKEKEISALRKQLENKKSAEHNEWLKSTIKLYQAMDASKAGRLLKTLPETEARELIYAMKKKKAAEILSSLDNETVKRLTRAKK